MTANVKPARIFPLGENAITVEFGTEISVELNDAAVSLAGHFTDHPFHGFVEAVPAIASTTIFYKAHEIDIEPGRDATAFDTVKEIIVNAAAGISHREQNSGRTIPVPVSFAPQDALDLASITSHSSLTENEVIDIFLSTTYRVLMLGFLPGFAYMGIVDERIAVPRRDAPRLSVPKGSVGIAGRQTGIYPSESPGGWQIIGRTDLRLFDAANDPPCLFAPGDQVRFTRADI